MTISSKAVFDSRDAAKRYAQLIFYHDNQPRPQYCPNPVAAWNLFCRQFSVSPNGAVVLSVLHGTFAMEMRRLVEARRERGISGKGLSPTPTKPGCWHQL